MTMEEARQKVQETCGLQISCLDAMFNLTRPEKATARDIVIEALTIEKKT